MVILNFHSKKMKLDIYHHLTLIEMRELPINMCYQNEQ